MSVTLHPVDIILLSISFLSVFVINYVCSKYRSTSGGHHEYFLTSRSMPFWAIGASLYASNIGTEHFVGQSGAAAASGIPVCLYEWSAIFILVLQIWIFAPVYLGYKPCPGQKYLIRPLSTIPEWFENRFDYRSRLLVVIVTLFMYVLTKISTLIFASGVLFKVTMGWSLYETIPFLLIFTGIYTMTGGLRAIMINDVVQMTFFTIGGCIGAYYSLFKIGGLQGIREVFKEADIEYFMHWYRGSDDAEYPSSGMFTGLFIVSIWFWIVDQEMAQRTLSAKNLEHARSGLLMAGFLKLFPTIIIMFPGLAARAYYEKCRLTNGAEFPNWCSAEFRSSGDDSIGAVSNGANTNAAYALLVVNEFPTGVVGIILASMVAAFFSSLASTLNSASTIFTIDIYWKIINPRASPKQIVFVGRLAVVFLVLISVAWLPILENQTGSLYIVCQAFGTYFAPTLTTVFLLGFFSSYITASGAFYGLLGGFIIGILRIIEYILTQNECHSFEIPNPKSSPTIGGNFFHCMHFQHFAILLTFTVAVLSISISFISKNFLEIEKPKEDLFSLDNGPFVNIEESKEVFSSANQNIKIWRNLNGILSIVVVAAAVSLYIIFY